MRARGGGEMEDLFSQSAKYRVDLSRWENFFLWARAMNQVLMSKLFSTIFNRDKVPKGDATEEPRIALSHREQAAV